MIEWFWDELSVRWNWMIFKYFLRFILFHHFHVFMYHVPPTVRTSFLHSQHWGRRSTLYSDHMVWLSIWCSPRLTFSGYFSVSKSCENANRKMSFIWTISPFFWTEKILKFETTKIKVQTIKRVNRRISISVCFLLAREQDENLTQQQTKPQTGKPGNSRWNEIKYLQLKINFPLYAFN